MENRESKFIFFCKAVAIISVVSAHVAGVGASAAEYEQMLSRLLSSFGTFGVPVFFCISGYLFERSLERKNSRYVVQSKIRRLLYPWLICGTAVWLYVVLRKGNLNLHSWFDFLIGNNSYLYYMTVLLCIYILYCLIGNYKVFMMLGILLSLLSNIVVIYYGWNIELSPYLNIFNWLLWFLLGGLVRKIGISERMKKIIRLISIPCMVIVIGITGWICSRGYIVSYWYHSYILLEVLGIFSLVGLYRVTVKCKLLEDALVLLGKYSFSIYLLHMPVAGVVANIMNRFPNGIFILTRPVIVILITCSIIFIGFKIVKGSRVEKWYILALGMR